jgi:hypothetical protein
VARPQYIVTSPNIIAAAAGSFFAGLLGASEQRGLMRNVLRTCMADKGYRRVRMSKASENRIRQIKGAEKDEAVYELASASEVEGEILPQ